MRTASTMSTPPDQRKNARVDFQAHVEIDLPSENTREDTRLDANSLNLSEGGMCLRLQAALQVRSRVRLRLFPEASKKPLECAGQISWVVQRMDLRDSPPFLYDVGVQFIDPPPRLRQFALRAGVSMKAPPVRQPVISSVVIGRRPYVPRLDHEVTGAWHLVVWVDEVPCFSHRYPSQREAMAGWETFQRQTAAEARQQSKPDKASRPRPTGRKRHR
jgi:hypothetical protein